MKILIVDDEKQLVQALVTILKQNKYSVDFAFDGEEGYDLACSGVYDLIILDVLMPKIDGFTLLKLLRANRIDTPILMLSAKSETIDKIEGLNLGADDYISKPFNTDELLARVRALCRRKEVFTGDLLQVNDLSLDRNTFELVCANERIALGKKEFQIMEMLILSKGKTVNKERLIEKIWGYDNEAEYNTIEVYVSFIRKKLQAIKSKTEIKSIRGIGYTIGNQDD